MFNNNNQRIINRHKVLYYIFTLVILSLSLCFILFIPNKDYNFDELSKIREEIYLKIPVAATKESLLKLHHLQDLDEILYTFKKNKTKGVWCGDAAFTLFKKYQDLGIESYILSYGKMPPGKKHKFSHAVVLVKEGNNLWVQDPYLNYAYKKNYNELITDLINGKIPEIIKGRPMFRDVHFHKDINYLNSLNKNKIYDLWTKEIDTFTNCSPTGENTTVCKFIMSIDFFNKYYDRKASYMDDLHEQINTLMPSLPIHDSNFLLFPYAIAGKDGYLDINNYDSDLNNGIFRYIVHMIQESSNGKINPFINRLN